MSVEHLTLLVTTESSGIGKHSALIFVTVVKCQQNTFACLSLFSIFE